MGKVFLVPVLWEREPLLASGTFQTQIDAPEETEILLGILWSRIGSPLPENILRPDGTRYDSGTAFEFEKALAGHDKKGKPDILLYRKLGAPSISLDDQEEVKERMEQINLLDAYIKKHLMAEDGSYIAAFHTFETEEQFESILKTHLRKLVLKQLEEPEEKEAENAQRTEDLMEEAPALPDTRSVAVLPFTNMSKDPEQEFFVDGLTEDIITELSRFKDLDVIARNSTFQYKGQSVDVRQVGQELGARYVLEGSVRKVGNALRVTGQLLDADDGSHLWAETYDRDLSTTSIFEVQDEISGRVGSIIGDIAGVLGHVFFEKLKYEDVKNFDSEQSVSFVNSYYMTMAPELHLRAREVIERAASRDTENGDVWAMVAQIYTDEFAFGFNASPDSLDRALTAGQRAVDLDPNSDRTHAALAKVNFFRGNISKALSESERALKISPNSAIRLFQHAYYLTLSGDWAQGLEFFEKALKIRDTIGAWFWYPIFLGEYRDGRYEDALQTIHKNGQPRFWMTHACYAAVHGQLGNMEEANAALAELELLQPDFEKVVRGQLKRSIGVSEGVDALLDGLCKAGLDIPDGPLSRGSDT